jgi:2-polyprenyl-6-hydroxyphenyl methylase/3-demethylubiquinone-9 3-methyltransferase
METEYSKHDLDIINNDYYHHLGQKWYAADDDPVALLRAESNLRNPWIAGRIHEFYSYKSKVVRVLDVGCGAGFLSNHLGREGFEVTAIDLSASSLDIARQADETKKVQYLQADAYELPFDNASFDVVTSTDFLEHVSEPQKVLREVARVVKPNGFFFFHTFNRNWLSNLLVIKSLEWFVKNTPEHLHVYDLFIKPKELRDWLVEEHFNVLEMHGMRPRIIQTPVFKLLFRGIVDPNFKFKWSSSLAVSYIGIARKKGRADI